MSTYFIYHLYHGNNGFIAAQILNENLIKKQQILKKLDNKILILRKKIELLKDNKQNNDFIDELARKYFMVGEIDENLLIITIDD
ncbi:FtsB family cell division protein [Lyticum sinuosum]|uniref:DivIC superfamily septum formation initiator n=1 Tax=Lyticum sinuosum TaxID=1332059 RepID=A0AAE4VK87_9RICK|nr:septum formation initiator family protein [Lyticum sinuosum]MDZ5761060.1 DivIC superfamily septum formation initiator [Lyticum sinuosum]